MNHIIFLAVSTIILRLKIKWFFKVLTDWDRNNKYVIKNAAGLQCFYAVEGNSFNLFKEYL